MQFYGQRATVMGLGRHGGGVGAAQYLAQEGARVTITDLADQGALADSLEELAGAGIERFHLGGHREADFTKADLVVVNPAVRPDNPLVELAQTAGARITSEIELFLDACPAPVIGVTGTTGKSTTAAMIAAALDTAGTRSWLGGNIGRSLLADLPRIQSDDWVVLELSSFQLHWLGENVRWPRLAVVTNFAPNHLDWHGSVEHYRQSKQRLLDHVRQAFQPDSHVDQALSPTCQAGKPDLRWPVADVPVLNVPGRHNRANAALAAAAASAAGADRESIVRGLAEFTGLPHRLQSVAEIAGRLFINDSKATTPEAAIAALESMDRPTWILLGGSDKQVDLSPLAAAAGRRARGAAVYGAVGDTLDQLLAAHAPRLTRYRAESLDEAFDWCWRQSRPGDAILLSPACASLDQFRDYIDRGTAFVRLVEELDIIEPIR
jgi:UDP-N-acetylmuramoylalanine--D-glutamate ligase